MGERIPISCNLNVKNENDFLYPVVFNSIIKCNLMISKFSPKPRPEHYVLQLFILSIIRALRLSMTL